MQAITTRYHGPTNHRGSRIKAVCAAGSITIAYDYSLDEEGVHRKAAFALRDTLGWTNKLRSVPLPNGDWAHVLI